MKSDDATFTWNGDVDALPVSSRIKNLIKRGEQVGLRSEAIISVLDALVGCGMSNADIFDVFNGFPIGDKYREKGSSKDRWLTKQIEAASAYVASNCKNPLRVITNADGDALPTIIVNDRQMSDITDAAMMAFVAANEPPSFFVMGGRIVRTHHHETGRVEYQFADDKIIRSRLARVAVWQRATKTGVTHAAPPLSTAQDILALGSWGLPPLKGIVTTPVLRENGTVLDSPGYDDETALIYNPASDFKPQPVVETPKKNDASRALNFIYDELFIDFPFKDSSSKANAAALLLTPIVRQLIKGDVPLAIIDSPQPGTGKSLLGQSISIATTGSVGGLVSPPMSINADDEWRKRITSLLMSECKFIIIDNVTDALERSSIAAAITAETWTDRILGKSATISIPQTATWAATGNNVEVGGDLPRRSYWIRLDAKTACPHERTGFKHSNLRDWVKKRQGKIIAKLLTMAMAWYQAGKPRQKSPPIIGGFQSWVDVIGGILEFAGEVNFLKNTKAFYAHAKDPWEGFVYELWKEFGRASVTVAEICSVIGNNALLKDALPDDLVALYDSQKQNVFNRALGRGLAKIESRFFTNGIHIEKGGVNRDKSVRWKIEKVELDQ